MDANDIIEWARKVVDLADQAPRVTVASGLYQIPLLQYSPAWQMRRDALALIAEVEKIAALRRIGEEV